MIPALAFNDQTSGISTDAMAFRDAVAASDLPPLNWST